MSDERHEWTDKNGAKWWAEPSYIDAPDICDDSSYPADLLAAECANEILNLARQLRERDEEIRELNEDQATMTADWLNRPRSACGHPNFAGWDLTKWGGDEGCHICRAESAERKLAEAEEAIRRNIVLLETSAAHGPSDAIDFDLECSDETCDFCRARRGYPAVRRALGKEGR